MRPLSVVASIITIVGFITGAHSLPRLISPGSISLVGGGIPHFLSIPIALIGLLAIKVAYFFIVYRISSATGPRGMDITGEDYNEPGDFVFLVVFSILGLLILWVYAGGVFGVDFGQHLALLGKALVGQSDSEQASSAGGTLFVFFVLAAAMGYLVHAAKSHGAWG